MKSNVISIFTFLLLFVSAGLSAQFNYLETFNTTSPPNLPSGWSGSNSYVQVNSISCAGGNSLRFEMYWLYSSPTATWPGFTSNSAPIVVEYRYNILDENFGSVSPTFPWGITISVIGSNNGTLYYQDNFTTTGPPYCGTRSFTVPANIVPANIPVKFDIRATTTNLPFYEFYAYVDNFTVDQPLPCATGATPANGSTNQNSFTSLAWDAVPGASVYNVYFGASPNPPLVSTQSGNSYTTGILQSNTTYYWKIVPENSSGITGSGCQEYSFSTINCETALGNGIYEISIPYTVTGRSTCSAGNDLTAANIPSNCYSNGDYLAGQDAVYIFTPSVSAMYDLKLTTSSGSDAALILYTGCPIMNGTGNCLASSVGTTGQERLISGFTLTAGTTYYLVVDNATLSNCIANYDLSIALSRPNCVTLVAPADGDYNIPAGNITLIWTPNLQNAPVPDGYNVFFGPESPLTSQVANTTGTSTLVYATEQGTLYAWKVIAYGIGGEALNCDTYTFGTRMNNDLCTNAAAFPGLPANGSCSTMTVSTFGTTGSGPACQGTADDDVWYTFSIPSGYNSVQYSTSNLTYSYMNRPIDNNRVFEIYNGCGGNLVGCYDAESGIFTNLVPGTTYYLRVFTQGNGGVSKFNLCLQLAAPVNDNCTNALAFPTVTADGNCATMSGNTANATNSGISSCGGNPDDDIWYTFSVPAGYTDVIYNTTYTSGNSPVRFAIYDACGGALKYCQDQSSGIFSNLGPGTYRLQVYTFGTGANSGFDLCLKLRPPNDLFANPIAFPTIPANGTCATQFINVFNATNSGDWNLCSNNNAIETDVWYTFTVPAGVTDLEYFNSNGTTSFLMELYSNSGSFINCYGFFGDNTFTNLTPGDTYRLRIYSPGNPTGGSFDLCIKTAAAGPPANDEPFGAVSITNANGGFVDPGTQSTALATQSWFPSYCCAYNNFDPNGMGCCNVPLPEDCLNFLPNAYDVWYKFTTNGGDINLTVNALNWDLILELYTDSGMPAQGNTTACNSGNQISLSATGLTAGTYYFRVYITLPIPALFTIAASGNALPVELSQFSGSAETEGNVLQWTTQTEKNVQWHVIERSEEGMLWEDAGQVPGQHSTQTTQKYRFVDPSPLPRAYYRLRSVDYDGQFSRSNVILLTRKTAQLGIHKVYPSPAADWVTVEFEVERKSNIHLVLTDISGRTILKKNMETESGRQQTGLMVGNLPPGLYFIAVGNDNVTSVPMRLVKQ